MGHQAQWCRPLPPRPAPGPHPAAAADPRNPPAWHAAGRAALRRAAIPSRNQPEKPAAHRQQQEDCDGQNGHDSSPKNGVSMPVESGGDDRIAGLVAGQHQPAGQPKPGDCAQCTRGSRRSGVAPKRRTSSCSPAGTNTSSRPLPGCGATVAGAPSTVACQPGK